MKVSPLSNVNHPSPFPSDELFHFSLSPLSLKSYSCQGPGKEVLGQIGFYGCLLYFSCVH
jgi:hypothetical protein